ELAHEEHRLDVRSGLVHDVELAQLVEREPLGRDENRHSTSARKRRVRSCFGAEKNSDGDASSITTPSSIIRIELATWCANRSSCDTTTIVIPSRARFSITSSTSRTSSTSSADVGS